MRKVRKHGGGKELTDRFPSRCNLAGGLIDDFAGHD